jgi:short-subunit dehydrogenase
MSALFAGHAVAVVGATGGLGEAIARALHREGADVVLLARDPRKLTALADELDVQSCCVDLHSMVSMEAAVLALGPQDAVVFATGCDVRKSLREHAERDVRHLLDVNLYGPILLTRLMLSRMRPGGVIAHLGGFGDGRLALPYYSVDVATRAGIAAFCESLNRELVLEDRNLTVSYLCPEPADTPAERMYAPLWASMGSQVVSPATVADFVLEALQARRRRAIMGHQTWLLAKVNALWPEAADGVALRRVGRLLRRAFARRGAA